MLSTKAYSKKDGCLPRNIRNQFNMMSAICARCDITVA